LGHLLEGQTLQVPDLLLNILLLGIHQIENAVTAYAALKASGLKISEDEIRKGFAEAKWRAVDGTGLLAWFLLAVFTSHQFCVELVLGHDQRVWMIIHSHTSQQRVNGKNQAIPLDMLSLCIDMELPFGAKLNRLFGLKTVSKRWFSKYWT
jgi:hypothetical protein